MEKTTSTKTKKTAPTSDKYFEGVGRRKTAVARVRIFPDKSGKTVLINQRKHDEYFPVARHQLGALAPLKLLKVDPETTVHVQGGGVVAQAEAVALGLSRALVSWTPSFKPVLKSASLLTRDSRMVERKKPGKRKARRAHQWKKR